VDFFVKFFSKTIRLLKKERWYESLNNPLLNRLIMQVIIQDCVHEKEVSRFLKRIKGKIFVDIGACVGYYALLLRNNFEKIYAFEPLPQNFQEMTKNLRSFHAKNVIPIMKAISNFKGETYLYLTEYGKYHQLLSISNKGLNVGRFSRHQLVRNSILLSIDKIKGFLPVSTSTLASFFNSEPSIDLVKVDVEGSEWDVLEGSLPIINQIQRWVVELHDLNRKIELEKWFHDKGYCTRWLDLNHIYAWRRNNFEF